MEFKNSNANYHYHQRRPQGQRYPNPRIDRYDPQSCEQPQPQPGGTNTRSHGQARGGLCRKATSTRQNSDQFNHRGAGGAPKSKNLTTVASTQRNDPMYRHRA